MKRHSTDEHAEENGDTKTDELLNTPLEAQQRSDPPAEIQDSRCGLGSFSPDWLQRLASKKTFVLVYGLVGCSFFAAGAYFIATISTMEKRFKISSKMTGVISVGEDVSFFFAVLAVGYLGSRGGGNKARWVAYGAVLVGLSSCLMVLPHLLFGPGTDALLLVDTEVDRNLTSLNHINKAHLCQSPREGKDCDEGNKLSAATAIFFFARILNGIGISTYWSLGIAYLDDNVLKTKMPLLLSIVGLVRMFGPTCGYLIASYTLNVFVAPTLKPAVDTNDPRWIGAWWLGWIPLGFAITFSSLVMFLFPSILPRAAKRLSEVKNRTTQTTKRSLKDFKETLHRLVRNPTFMYNTCSTVFMILGFIGHWYFLPKYLETQFRQSAARASLITGSVGIVFTGFGLLVSGAVMSRFQPRARYLAAWNVMVELLELGTRIIYMFIGCPTWDLQGEWDANDKWNLTTNCNSLCECGVQGETNYSPVCSGDKTATFYSSCYAGCTSEELINGTKTYLNCSCIGGEFNFATEGACPVDCTTNFMVFLIFECLVRFLSASGRAGNSLIQYRCVNPDDKSVSLGLSQFIYSITAFIPGPIMYGAILDSSCLIWGSTCGKSGNCWLYNGLTLPYMLNGTAAVFMVFGSIFDVGVWCSVKGLEIYEEDHKRDKDDEKPPEEEVMMKEF